MKSVTRILKDQKGQGMIEYAVAVIVIIAIGALIITLGDTNPLFTAIQAAFTKVASAVGGMPDGPAA